MSKSVRISDRAWELLNQRARAERRTVLAVVDMLTGVPEGSDAGLTAAQRSSGAAAGGSDPFVDTALGLTPGPARGAVLTDIQEPDRSPVAAAQRSNGGARPVDTMITEMNEVTRQELARPASVAPADPTQPIRFPLSVAPRCACGHLETVHLGGKRCQAVGCDCRKVAPVEDRT